MPIKYDKAIAVGMAGILLIFIAIYLATDRLGINTTPVDDSYSLVPVFVMIGVTFFCLIIIGFISACIESTIVSRADAIKVSVVSGVVPLSIVAIGIIYVILYLGIFAALPYVIIGLIIVLVGVICASIGGVIGYKFATTYLTRNALL